MRPVVRDELPNKLNMLVADGLGGGRWFMEPLYNDENDNVH